jgi:RNA polymerase sigma factor (sigma-70 family)
MLDFSETYDEHLDRVYGFIAYRVASRPDAEDLTQQTFERALAHWSEFDSRRANVGTGLLAIARNLVIDHYRTSSRRGPTVELGELPERAEPVAGPDVSLGISPELTVALAELGDRERELIALRFGADCSGPEIARLTGLSLANVQQILSRSLRHLRATLAQMQQLTREPTPSRVASSDPDLDTDDRVR